MGKWDRDNIDLTKEFTSKGNKRVRFFRELTGKFFGNVEVLKRLKPKGRNVIWLCKCHACGKEFERLSVTLKPETKSCGCVRRQQGSKHVHWRGFGDVPGSYVTYYKNNAKKRAIAFDITGDYMWELFLHQDRKCALSGLPIRIGRKGREEVTASLDRKDSSKGYVIGNVQWVHKHINMMKLDHDQDYFIKLCSQISFNQNRI